MEVVKPGSVFAGYRVLSMLGRGGMGQVWLVEHPTLGRREALKIISPNPADPSFAERFRNEARTAAALDHPGIVTVADKVLDRPLAETHARACNPGRGNRRGCAECRSYAHLPARFRRHAGADPAPGTRRTGDAAAAGRTRHAGSDSATMSMKLRN